MQKKNENKKLEKIVQKKYIKGKKEEKIQFKIWILLI